MNPITATTNAATVAPTSAVGTSGTVGSTTATATAPTGTAGTALPSASLGKNDFLQLMMQQLKNQDPLNPSDPSQYLSELAQFSALEQQTNIATSAAAQTAEQNTVAAIGLIGHSVTYTDANGNSVTGLVNSVQFTPSGPSLTVAGLTGVSPGSVNNVS